MIRAGEAQEENVMSDKKYTCNFFDRCISDWNKWLSHFKDQPNLRFLEIGSLEGRSTCWLMDNILTHPTSKILCLDLFDDSGKQGVWSNELYCTHDFPLLFSNFRYNIEEYGNQVEYKIGMSQKLLKDFKENDIFDFVYIDGSHIASDVLQDIVLAFPLLKTNGIMILDDYTWEMFGNPLRHPKIAVDAFLEIYQNQYRLISKGRQVVVQKNGRKEG